MTTRNITADDLTKLEWIEIPQAELHRVDFQEGDLQERWWRIVAEMVCSSCGAFQAVDSDPTNDRKAATRLTVGLFHDAGWRVDENGGVHCAECASN